MKSFEEAFIHPVISVSLYSETPFLTRILKPKCLKLGMYTRKSPVLLKVQSDAVIESYDKQEIVFNVENLEFSLLNSRNDGRCTFVVRDQIIGLVRIYQVASFVELCWWFESLKTLKDQYLERQSKLGRGQREGPCLDLGFAFVPQPKRLSLKSVASTLIDSQTFESHTLSSLQNLQDMSQRLQELKNSICRKYL